VIIDGGIAQERPVDLRPHPAAIAAKRKALAQVVNGTEVLPFAPGRQPDHRRSGARGLDASASSRRIRSPATPSRSGSPIPPATAGR
jgi:hypothetical protein